MPNPCPRFDRCDAPVCPLDDWKASRHVKGEPVCFYLREATKQGASAPLTGDIPKELAEEVSIAHREIVSSPCSPFGDIRRRLLRAAKSPSKRNAVLVKKSGPV